MIQLNGVRKRYRWRSPWSAGFDALHDVSLVVEPGEAVGILGPNGAGKSTLIRMLLGHARPTSGTIRVAGMSPRSYVERRGIAFVPEAPTLPPRWTVRGTLRAFAALGDLPDEEAARINETLRSFGLEPHADRPAGRLSKGQRQRLVLAQAFLCDRKLLLLDEAFQGLDPVWRDRVHAEVDRWRAADPERILLLASHDLREIERHASRVVALVGGSVRLDTRLEALPGAQSYAPERHVSPLERAFRRVIEEAEGEAAA